MKQASRFSIQPGWRVVFADVGIDPASVLTLAGLPSDLFSRSAPSLSAAEYFRFWHGIELVAGEATVPMRLGKALSVEAFDPAIFASLCSPDLNVALARMAQFKRLIGPLHLEVTVGRQHTAATFSCHGAGEPLPRSLVAFEFIFVTQLVQLATRRRVTPLFCEVVELPVGHGDYEASLGCPLRIGPANVIGFSAEDAARPFLTENIPMWDAFEPGLRMRLSRLEREAGLGERVRTALLDMLPSGRSSVEAVAQRLAVSKRTLQRGLEEEGLVFRDVLSAVRRELAEHYLKNSNLPLAEIAYLLGFDDANSFQRAFKGWTGRTAGKARQQAADPAARSERQ